MSSTTQIKSTVLSNYVVGLSWSYMQLRWNRDNLLEGAVKELEALAVKKDPNFKDAYPEFQFLNLKQLIDTNTDEITFVKKPSNVAPCTFTIPQAIIAIEDRDDKRLEDMFTFLTDAWRGLVFIAGSYTPSKKGIKVTFIVAQ